MTGWEEKAQRNYYFWVMQGGSETIVFDCGVRPLLAAEKNLVGYQNPEAMLAEVNIKAIEVDHLVLSHGHFDHIGCIDLFPKANVYIQRKEFDFWVHDPISNRPPFAKVVDPEAIRLLGNLRGTDRLVLLDGDQTILPGIELLLTPGHTPGLQSMAVNTEDGEIVLTSDCAHIRESFVLDLPSSLITDMPAWLLSYSKLKKRVNGNVSKLIPGHDPELFNKFPKVAESITRLA